MANDTLSFGQYGDEILAETDRLAALLDGADLSVTVPTCPDWDLAELVRHLGITTRWAGTIIRTRATQFVPHSTVPDREVATDTGAMAEWLRRGAAEFVREMRAAGPDAKVWTGMPVEDVTFWARRIAYETVVHRADAAHTVGEPFHVGPDVAADAIDEWLFILASPWGKQAAPGLSELRGPAVLALRATDVDAGWLVEIGDGGFTWRRGSDSTATVTLRGPVCDVMQVFYRRLPMDHPSVEVVGRRELLADWLARANF